MGYYVKALSNYTNFKGRATRMEYWMYCLVTAIISFILSILDSAFIVPETGVPVLTWIYALAVLLPGIAIVIRRLHDTDRSGWWYLIAFIPIVGCIVLIVFMCLDGTVGKNRYGLDPKGRGTNTTGPSDGWYTNNYPGGYDFK